MGAQRPLNTTETFVLAFCADLRPPNGLEVHPQDAFRRAAAERRAGCRDARGIDVERLQAAWRRASRVAQGGSAAGRGIRRLVRCYVELGRTAFGDFAGISDQRACRGSEIAPCE